MDFSRVDPWTQEVLLSILKNHRSIEWDASPVNFLPWIQSVINRGDSRALQRLLRCRDYYYDESPLFRAAVDNACLKQGMAAFCAAVERYLANPVTASGFRIPRLAPTESVVVFKASRECIKAIRITQLPLWRYDEDGSVVIGVTQTTGYKLNIHLGSSRAYYNAFRGRIHFLSDGNPDNWVWLQLADSLSGTLAPGESTLETGATVAEATCDESSCAHRPRLQVSEGKVVRVFPTS